MNSSSSIVKLYRSMIKLAGRLDGAQQENTRKQIITKFRRNAVESDPIKIAELVKEAEDKLAYLKMITPKVRSNQPEPYRKIFGPKTVQIGTKAVTNWHGGNMDPDSVARHYAGLKRAGLRDNSHAKGGMF